ncbi:hypothetical protein JTB14_008808 [Gonioctena quinquepunctata]|nr:hypothetical protein JTB14_008808 [Gonioctena quinquepunctata]
MQNRRERENVKKIVKDQISVKDLREAGLSKRESTDYTSHNSQTDETSCRTDRDMPRGKVNYREKQSNRSDREEALRQAQDEHNQMEEDIKNEARK